ARDALAGPVLDELPRQVLLLRAARDAEAVAVRRRPVAGHLRGPESLRAHPLALRLHEEIRRRVSMQNADIATRESAIGLDPTAGPGDAVDRAVGGGACELVERLDAARRVECDAIALRRQELDLVHLEQRLIEPVEVEREEAALVAARQAARDIEDLVEAL